MKKRDRGQYVFSVAFSMAAMLIIVIYNLFTFYSRASSDMIARGRSSLNEEKALLQNYLIKGMDVLQVTAISVEYMMKEGASPEEIETFLLEESVRYAEDIDENFTGIYGLFLGEYLDGIGWVPDEDYVPKEREWYIAAVEGGGKPVVVSPYLDAQTNTIMISVSQLLYDNDSVISLDIVLDQVQYITKDIKLDDMGYGFVVDGGGLVVAHSDEHEKGSNYLENGDMREVMDKVYNNPESTFNAEVNGESCTVFSTVIMDDWHVVMIIRNNTLYHDIWQILMRNIIVCLLVFILIFYFYIAAFRKIRWHMKKEEESRQNLEKMNESIIQTLVRTIDAKDHYTNGHSVRVAKYALELAKRMGKSEEEQKQIHTAALLHDVGKIRVPDAIISKPTRLTEEEFAYIKLHPVSGYYILRGIEGNSKINQGAKWHHERFDGKGYPNGLKGKSIPETARIIGVADAYDAMTSERSYRQIMPQEAVRAEIEKGRGTQFDPEIADIMLTMIDEDKNYDMCQKKDHVWKILAVGDEHVNCDMIELALQNEHCYEVYKAASGKEALDILKNMEADLVLLDIIMPDMDGFAIYEEIHKNYNIPVVFMSVDRDADTVERAAKLGVEDYLVKPFMPQILIEMLHSILSETIN